MPSTPASTPTRQGAHKRPRVNSRTGNYGDRITVTRNSAFDLSGAPPLPSGNMNWCSVTVTPGNSVGGCQRRNLRKWRLLCECALLPKRHRQAMIAGINSNNGPLRHGDYAIDGSHLTGPKLQLFQIVVRQNDHFHFVRARQMLCRLRFCTTTIRIVNHEVLEGGGLPSCRNSARNL